MNKILFLGSGSKDDPGFDNVQVKGRPYKEYMKEKGIIVLDKVIESCHGCYDLMTDYSKQMQNAVENGDRVVSILEGGLLFGLPSIQATQTTYPIISVPMDAVSYTAFMVPTGHAVVAGVGVPTEKEEYGQKEKALTLAEKMLNLQDKGVCVVGDISDGKLEKELAKYGIKTELGSELVIASNIYGRDDVAKTNASMMIRADPDENMKSWEYLNLAEQRHHMPGLNYVPTAQVKGAGNLAIYAAKILSLQNPELREKIKAIAEKKRAGYETRNLTNEIQTRRE